MQELIKRLCNLLTIKSIVTLMVMIVFVTLALKGDITPDKVMYVVTTVIGFYFGTQLEKRAK